MCVQFIWHVSGIIPSLSAIRSLEVVEKVGHAMGTSNCDLVPGKAHFRFIFKHLRLKCLLCQCPEQLGGRGGKAWQAVQNHHKRQEMRKQIARRDEREKKLLSPMLEVYRGVWRRNEWRAEHLHQCLASGFLN